MFIVENEVPQHLAETLALLKELQRRLDTDMNSGLAASRGAGINEKHVRMAMQLSTASSNLSREARNWLKKSKELASAASLEERLAAVTKFIKELPPSEREKLNQELA